MFQNEHISYPINGVPDNVTSITYRSHPSGWINGKLLVLYFSDSNVITLRRNGILRKVFMDSCRIHNDTTDLTNSSAAINTEVKRFKPNYTTISQLLNQFTLRVFKRTCCQKWVAEKARLAAANQFTNSWRIRNPGKLSC